MNEYFVYIIYSSKSQIYYIGHTNNLIDRVNRHNQNRNKFTKGKGPWRLVTSQTVCSKSEAYRLEMKLKAFKNSKLAIDYLQSLVLKTPI